MYLGTVPGTVTMGVKAKHRVRRKKTSLSLRCIVLIKVFQTHTVTRDFVAIQASGCLFIAAKLVHLLELELPFQRKAHKKANILLWLRWFFMPTNCRLEEGFFHQPKKVVTTISKVCYDLSCTVSWINHGQLLGGSVPRYVQATQ